MLLFLGLLNELHELQKLGVAQSIFGPLVLETVLALYLSAIFWSAFLSWLSFTLSQIALDVRALRQGDEGGLTDRSRIRREPSLR